MIAVKGDSLKAVLYQLQLEVKQSECVLKIVSYTEINLVKKDDFIDANMKHPQLCKFNDQFERLPI